MHSRPTLFEELSRNAGVSVDTRAQNSFTVAVKFFELLKSTTPDDRAYDLMMKAWFRAVKDGDYKKFHRTYQKYKDSQEGDIEK